MSGYPPGTKCVITWARPEATQMRIGQIVTTGEYVTPPGHVYFSHITNSPAVSKRWMQHLVDVPSERKRFIYPVNWMRPIDEDIDEDDEEVIELLKGRELA